MTAYRARWLFTGTGEFIENGILTVAGDTITDVACSGKYAIDLGDVLLMPGLINAHTHLEFSVLDKPLEPREHFAEWIRSVIKWRRRNETPVIESIQAGLELSLNLGVTSLGEIATIDWRSDIAAAFPDVVMFREYLGLAEDHVESHLEDARRFLTDHADSRHIQPALSPHAPYSVHPRLFEGLCQLGQENSVPVAMHLAETPSELELLQSGTGSLVELFRELEVWKPGIIPLHTRPLDYLKRLAELPQVLIIHGNYLDEEEISFIAQHPQMSVVYCPRTHAAMQPDAHPWKTMQSAGINVALGTDSLASNPDLSIWHELQFLHTQDSEIAANDLLTLATANAAQALGLKHGGMLQVGKSADLCVIQPDLSADSLEDCFLGRAARVVGVMQRGAWRLPPS